MIALLITPKNGSQEKIWTSDMDVPEAKKMLLKIYRKPETKSVGLLHQAPVLDGRNIFFYRCKRNKKAWVN